MSYRRTVFHRFHCPACGNLTARNSRAEFVLHGPVRSRCDGTGRNVIETVGRTPGNPFTDEQIAMMNTAYRTADWVPVEETLGVTFPRCVIDPDFDADQVLAHLVHCVRCWLERLATTGTCGVRKARSA